MGHAPTQLVPADLGGERDEQELGSAVHGW
jgi:hypothetical protein